MKTILNYIRNSAFVVGVLVGLLGISLGYGEEVRKIEKPSYPRSVWYNLAVRTAPVKYHVAGILASSLESANPSMAERYMQLYYMRDMSNEALKGFKSGIMTIVRESVKQELKNTVTKSLFGEPYKNTRQNSSFAVSQSALHTGVLPFDPLLKLDILDRNFEVGGSRILAQGVDATALFDSEYSQLKGELNKKTKDGYNLHLKTSHAFSGENETQVEVGFNFKF